MWDTDTYWFDVAVVTTVLMVGHLCFGRFVPTDITRSWGSIIAEGGGRAAPVPNDMRA